MHNIHNVIHRHKKIGEKEEEIKGKLWWKKEK